jgi:hypothetical protein
VAANERGFVSNTDLVRWTISQALTCAATLVPQSLGKATLFRVSSIRQYGKDDPWQPFRREIRIYSSEFVGVFSPSQLTEPRNPARIRTFLMGGPNQREDEVPVALKCLRAHEPLLELLPSRSSFDSPELAVGTTHVLALPLYASPSDVRRPDQPVAITIDLHIGWLSNKVMHLPFRDPHKQPTYSRAYKLMKLLQDTMPAWEEAEQARQLDIREKTEALLRAPSSGARRSSRRSLIDWVRALVRRWARPIPRAPYPLTPQETIPDRLGRDRFAENRIVTNDVSEIGALDKLPFYIQATHGERGESAAQPSDAP